MTLRAQIALTTGLISLLVVALAGAILAFSIDHRDRHEVDAQLQERASRVSADADKLLHAEDKGDQGTDGYGDLLDGTESLVRLIVGSSVVAQRGEVPSHPVALPTEDGFTTIQIDGSPWRSYVLSTDNDIELQVLQSLEPVNQRRASNVRLIALVTLLAMTLSGAAGWLVGGRVLRPLGRLAEGAAGIEADPNPQHRLPEVTGPHEVTALSHTLNGMLDRLDASTATTRQFAADVGHELRGPLTAATSYLEVLLARSDVEPDVHVALAAVQEQQGRMANTLSALQALARVDAGATPAFEEVEVGPLVEELVRLARHRHSSVNFRFTDTMEQGMVSGWREGLRMAIDNLIDNAAIHGSPGGAVKVTVQSSDDEVHVIVADEGSGLPDNMIEAVRGRFVRGPNTSKTPGTGLGLALVDQLAHTHGGRLDLRNGTPKGFEAELSLPLSKDL